MVNQEDLSLVIPSHLNDHKFEKFYESTFFYPLMPTMAYISCDLILSNKIINFQDINLENIFYLNFWTVLNSYKYIYSSIPKNNQSYIKVYTSIDSIISIGNLVDNSDFSLLFQFENKDHLKKLQLNISVSFVEAIENGESIRGMRNCIVKEINLENGI